MVRFDKEWEKHKASGKKIVRVELLSDWNDGSKKGEIKKYGLEDALALKKEGMVKILDDVEEPMEYKEKVWGRLVGKKELVIEDVKEVYILMIAGKMEKAGYYLEYYKAPRQESGHLHVKDIALPEDATIVQSNKYKELIIKKYVNENLWDKIDWTFYDRKDDSEPHRIVTENTNHYKGYGVKSLVRIWGDKKENPFEKKIWDKAIEETAFGNTTKGEDVEDWNEFINKVIPHWIEGKRQNLSLSVGGYLRKNKRLGIEKVKSIITEICKKAKDDEIPMRLKGVDETFKKDEKDVKGISGLEFLDKKEIDYQKPIIEHPKTGKLISEFAEQTSNILKETDNLFYRPGSNSIVEISKIKTEETNEKTYLGFVRFTPNRFITLLEKYVSPGVYVYNPKIKQMEFHEKSITQSVAQIVLESEILVKSLPQISRIFRVQIPILYEGKLTFPKKGYDQRFSSWLPFDAPEISNPNMSLKDAKNIIYNILKEFCFKSKQDYTVAIAGLLTPFLRGLYSSFNIRTPIIAAIANQQRCGKDFYLNLRGIIYEGSAIENSPLSTGERNSNKDDEIRKKIFTYCLKGKSLCHFANNKGFIDVPSFEQASTAKKLSDRILGKTDSLELDNEMDFSLSGNVGVTFSQDLEKRCIFVNLYLDIEDVNTRTFENPLLDKWVLENRPLILSAMYSLIKNWFDKGMPKGKIPFTSFPEWAIICGGIMESAEYSNPCVKDEEGYKIGDIELAGMKELFEIVYERRFKDNQDYWIKKKEIRDLIENEEIELFKYLDLEKRVDQVKFASLLNKYLDRTLSDIHIIIKDKSVRSIRQELRFTKEVVKIEKQTIFGDEMGKTRDLDDLGDKIGQLGQLGLDCIPEVNLSKSVKGVLVRHNQSNLADQHKQKNESKLSDEEDRKQQFLDDPKCSVENLKELGFIDDEKTKLLEIDDQNYPKVKINNDKDEK